MQKSEVKKGMVVRISLSFETIRGLIWGYRNGIVIRVNKSTATVGFHQEGAWTALAFGGPELRSSNFSQIERFNFSELEPDPPPVHYLSILEQRGLIGKEK